MGSKPPRALSSRPLHARTCLCQPLSSHHGLHSRARHLSCCYSEKQFPGFSLRLREIPSKPVSIVHKITLLIISPHSLSFSLLAGNPNPVSSGKTGGRGDVAMNGIQTFLAALKDGSALVAKVPYISPMAGLLLQTLTMRDVSVLVRFRGRLY